MPTVFQNKVFALTKQIPYGKVSTYKEIAQKLHIRSYRAVGQALKNNQNPETIPCFKIVKSNGEIGGYSGTKPQNIQKKIKKLAQENILVENNKIDLKKHLFQFKTKTTR